MSDPATTNYGWVKPTVGGDTDTWGGSLNSDLDGIDTTVFGVATSLGVVSTALSTTTSTTTSSLTGLTTSTTAISTSLSNLTANTTLIAGELVAVSMSLSNVSTSVSNNSTSLVGVSSSLSSTAVVDAGQSSSLSQVSSSLSSVSSSLSSTISTNTTQSTSLSQISSSLSNASSSLANVSTSLGGMSAGSSANSIGYLGMPFVALDANHTFALSDSGKFMRHSDGSAYTWTIPARSSVAFDPGSAIALRNGPGTGVITLARSSGVTLSIAGSATNQNISLAQSAFGTLVQEADDFWVFSGVGAS